MVTYYEFLNKILDFSSFSEHGHEMVVINNVTEPASNAVFDGETGETRKKINNEGIFSSLNLDKCNLWIIF